MKFRTIIALSVAALSFTACDDIDESDRLIGPIEFTPMKNVLVEDFTGQLCINCPRAAEALKAIQRTYGTDHVIAVAIHGGGVHNSIPAPYGFANSESESYIDHWGIVQLGFPKGIVDRTNEILDYTAWSAHVVERLQKTPQVDLTAHAAYDATTNEISVSVDATCPNNAVSGNLQVWLTESNLIGFQMKPDGQADSNYEHNHVFRAAVNGKWGEQVTLPQGGQLSKSFSYTPESGWKVENMSAVVFVYNETGGVLQVIDTEIETNE